MRFPLFAALCFASLAAAQPALKLREYRVLFDPQKEGYRANSATAALLGKELQLVFTGAIEDDVRGPGNGV